VDHRFKLLIRVGALVIICSLWLCRNYKVFNDKIILSCRLFTDVTTRKRPIAAQVIAGAPKKWYAGDIYCRRTNILLRQWY
jgi:hypothetical protein